MTNMATRGDLKNMREDDIRSMRDGVTDLTESQDLYLSEYGYRNDGTRKGSGFFGEMRAPSGDMITEFSITTEVGGKPLDIPLVNSFNTREELDAILNNRISDELVEKAFAHAQMRMESGLPVQATKGDTVSGLLRDFDPLSGMKE